MVSRDSDSKLNSILLDNIHKKTMTYCAPTRIIEGPAHHPFTIGPFNALPGMKYYIITK